MISVYSPLPLVGPCPGGAAAGELSEFDLPDRKAPMESLLTTHQCPKV